MRVLITQTINRLFFNYAPRYDIDMIKKRFCIGTYIGGILETFKISSSGIEPCGMNKLFKSRYTKFDNGAVSWNDESQIGFDDISAEPDHIYLKSASNLNGNLNCSKELEHYAS